MKAESKKATYRIGKWIGAILLGLVVCGVHEAGRQNLQAQTGGEKISGQERQNFIAEFKEGCLEETRNNAQLRQLLGDAQIDKYCTCVPERMAATRSRADIRKLKGNTDRAYVEAALNDAALSCIQGL